MIDLVTTTTRTTITFVSDSTLCWLALLQEGVELLSSSTHFMLCCMLHVPIALARLRERLR